MFRRNRNKTKLVIIIILAAMVGGGLWAAIVSFLGGSQAIPTEAAVAVAKVNGQAISLYDLYLTQLRFAQQLEQQQGPLTGRIYEALRYEALEALVDSVLVHQEINKRKISASRAEVDAELQELIDLFGGKEEFQQQLQRAGLSEASLRAQLEHQIKVDKLQEQLVAHVSVSEEDIRAAYERVRASHILIKPAGSSDEDWEAAEARAWEIYSQVTPENFPELAKEVSEDASSASGGELGYIYRGKTVPEFEEAVFALGVGEISEPVRSTYGYHIITVTDRVEAEGEEFEKARAELEKDLRLAKGQEDIEAWLQSARDSSEIVLMEHRLNAFKQMQEGNYEDAVHYYKLALEDYPEDGYLHSFLGDAYHGLGDLEGAIEQYRVAAEKEPTDYTLLYSLGKLYEEAEDIDQAVEQYIKAAELVPNDIFALLTLYHSVTALERWEDAKAIEKLIEEFQERQNALLQPEAEGEAATEAAEGEAEELPELVEEKPGEAAAEAAPQE